MGRRRLGRQRGVLVRLECATFLSGAGNGAALVIFPWLTLELTGSASAAGLVAAAAAMPLVFVGIIAGSVVDRLGRRTTAVVADLMSSASLAAVPLVDLATTLDTSWLAVLAFCGALFDPAGFTARESMLPEVARQSGVRPARLNGVHEAVFGLAGMMGPGLGGLLISLAGPIPSFLPAAGAFLLSALLCAGIKAPGAARSGDPLAARSGLWRATREGLSFVRRDPVLVTLAVLTTTLVCTWMPIEAVVLPAHFQASGQSGQLGALLMAMSGGAALGALSYAAVGYRWSRRVVFVVAFIGTSAAVAAMAALPDLLILLALGFVSGLLYGPMNPITNLAIQERTPGQLRGRVVGTMTSIAYAAGPVGFLITGPLVSGVGVRTSFVILAVAMLAAATVSPFLAALRLLDHPPQRSPMQEHPEPVPR